ncbi:hypothetical protein GCM10027346_32730 [Hymenobacter seoulensis]
MKTLIYALPLAVLVACSTDSKRPNPEVVMHNNFDSLVGWVPDASLLTKERAHSGQYSIKVDNGQDYSLTYTAPLGQLSETRLRGTRLEAWVFMTDKDAKARLGFLVKDPENKNVILNDGLDLREQVKESGEWVKISKDFTFPPTVNYTSSLVIFLWGPEIKRPIYLDDIQLTALR